MALKQPPKARSVLALDVGRRRIGLAGCDPLGLSVTPLPALHRGRFHHGAGFRQRYERFEIFNHSNYSQKETVAQCMLCGPPPVGRAA